MDDLQKIIVGFFALTIILSIGCLLMFFVEVPYKSTVICKDNLTAGIDATNIMKVNNHGIVQDCYRTVSKEPSELFNGMINASIASGILFLLVSAYAYYKKRKTVQPQ